MKRDLAGPQRTCVGCRQRAEKAQLLRVVNSDGILVIDLQSRQPGRGAYLHRALDCVELADQRRAVARALRSTTPIDLEPVRQFLTNESITPPK
jgi:predicted RNA-binding protein YlxR (DUF448 family)